MFIREQEAEFREIMPSFRDEWIERLVWSPVACRHCMWSYQPLVKTNEKGKTIKGSRRRNTFHPYA